MRKILAALTLLLAAFAQTAVAQAQDPVYVVTHIDLMPNGVPAGIPAMKQFVAESLKMEKECVRFEILQQDGRPNHLTLVGIWKDRKAFDAHDSAPYTKEFREKMQPLIGSPWDERLHQLIKP
jgi:quinol monooxygenase YgiN